METRGPGSCGLYTMGWPYEMAMILFESTVMMVRCHGDSFGAEQGNMLLTRQLRVSFMPKWVFSQWFPDQGILPRMLRSPPVKWLLANSHPQSQVFIPHNWQIGQVCCLFLLLVLWAGHKLPDLWIHSSVPIQCVPTRESL